MQRRLRIDRAEFGKGMYREGVSNRGMFKDMWMGRWRGIYI